VPPRPQEVKFAYCSSDKSRRLLGYETKKKLADIVLEMVAWIRKRGTLPFDYYLPLEIVNDRTPKTWTERLI
jgi:UDP-glucose 4-epimerase